MPNDAQTDQNYNRRTYGRNFPIVGKYIVDMFPQLAAEKFEQVGYQTEAYRPLLNESMMQAQDNAFSGMQPLNAAMGRMYGDSAMTDYDAMQTPVITPEMLEIGGVDDIIHPAEDAVAAQNPRATERIERRTKRREKRANRQGRRTARQNDRLTDARDRG